MQLSYVAKRCGVFLLIVWLAATLNFFLPRLSGQDPVREKLLQQAQLGGYVHAGIEAMTRTYWELNKFDIETRIADEGRADLRPLLIAKDITDDGVVLQTADVKVTAFRTPHPPISDNFAYKFETPDGIIVFSSDTAYNPKLAEFAKTF